MKGIGKVTFFISAVLFMPFILASEEGIKEDVLRVLKTDGIVYMRSPFSPVNDLLVRVGLGGGNKQVNFAGTFLLDRDADMSIESLKAGKLLHGNGDDATPWRFNGTYIGGNHGAAVGWELACKGHGLTAKDLGSEWEDALGRKHYLVKIGGSDSLMFVGSNSSDGNIWKIERRIEGSLLKNAASGASIEFTGKKLYQVRPACRITRQEYLLDGKTPLKEGEAAECRWLDIVEEYDIINLGSLLADIIAHPGEERDFAAAHLDGVVSNNITYRFFPNGSNIIYYRAKALQDFKLGYMGFIQSSRLYKGDYQTHEYYIPKTLPFTKDGINYDFRGIQDYSSRLPSPLYFREREKNITDPGNLPERFIQFLGKKDGENTVREVGYALGYSLLHGLTVPEKRALNTSSAITLYTSNKSYPSAINSKMGPLIPAGTDFYCIAYRHYFNPRDAGNATAVYWQKQEDDIILYADYHKSVDKDILKVPAEMIGKNIGIVEKTPSVTLHTAGKVSEKGLEVSVKDGYGYMVLRAF